MDSSLTIETFTGHRQFLFSIAYRMLGSLSEAEDMVQEAWLRWQTQDTVDYEAKWGHFFINGKTFTTLVYAGV